MGQHKFNPTAIAAARGEISKETRLVSAKTPAFTMRDASGDYNSVPCVRITAKRQEFTNAFIGRVRNVDGYRLQRKIAKVKGKANAKRAKKARQIARQAAA